jgi:hypothetical protein
MDDEAVSGRKLLREHGNVQMWQEYIAGPHRDTGQLLRYFVARSGEPPKSFAAPHDAFAHFQKLTNAPTSPRRPPPSPKRGPSQR